MGGLKDKNGNKNAPTKVLGVELAPLHLPWERRYQTFCVVIWFCISFLVPLSGYPTIFYLLFYSSYQKLAWIIIPPYLLWIWVIDPQSCNKGGRVIPWVRKWSIWRGYSDYFPIKLVKTCDLDPNRNYLFGSHPHGILCSGVFGCFATDSRDVQKVYPGLRFHVLTLEVNYRFPILRDFMLSLGVCAASRKGMNYLLSQPGGGTAGILIPGGAPESLDSHPGSYVVQLKNRKGFIKVAIQNGAWLVPVFTFGETEIYDQSENPKGSLLRKVQDAIQGKTQLAPVLFRGRGIFQYTFGYLPRRRPLTVVVGAPIQVEKVEQPSNDFINEIHQKYVDAVVELFYKHREEYASDPNHVITIV